MAAGVLPAAARQIGGAVPALSLWRTQKNGPTGSRALDFALLPLEAVAWAAGVALFAIAGYSILLFAIGSMPSPHAAPGAADPAKVTVMVTALGGSPVLGGTLRRADAIEHPDLQLLLALGTKGDGSAAAGGGLARPLDVFESDEPLGKAHAMNSALARAEGDYLLLLDEDSMVDPGCLRATLPLAQDPGVWAVVGEPYATNAGSGVIQRTLGLESGAWVATARAKDRLGLFLPATGFFALIRKASLPGGSPWDEDALAEDTDLSLRQEARGMRTRLSAARVGIEAPSTLGDLARQRLRWYKGMFDALWKNRHLVAGLPLPKALDVTLTLLSPLGPAALVVLLLLAPLWPALLGPVLAGALVLYLLSAWAASSGLKRGRLGVVLFSVPYVVAQGAVALAALAAFLLHVRVRWQRTPKAADAGRRVAGA